MRSRTRLHRVAWATSLWLSVAHPAPAVPQDGYGVQMVRGQALSLAASGSFVKAYFFDVYTVALYLSDHVGAHVDLLHARGPKRLALTIRRRVSPADLRVGMASSLQANAVLHAYRLQLVGIFERVGSARGGLAAGDQVTIDWSDAEGVMIRLNAVPCFGPVRDPGLFEAILRLWLDEDPSRSILKTEAALESGRHEAINGE